MEQIAEQPGQSQPQAQIQPPSNAAAANLSAATGNRAVENAYSFV